MTETLENHNRLFAKILVEEYNARERVLRREWGFYGSYLPNDERPAYLSFLKSQRSRSPWCPYSMAVKSIQG